MHVQHVCILELDFKVVQDWHATHHIPKTSCIQVCTQLTLVWSLHWLEVSINTDGAGSWLCSWGMGGLGRAVGVSDHIGGREQSQQQRDC